MITEHHGNYVNLVELCLSANSRFGNSAKCHIKKRREKVAREKGGNKRDTTAPHSSSHSLKKRRFVLKFSAQRIMNVVWKLGFLRKLWALSDVPPFAILTVEASFMSLSWHQWTDVNKVILSRMESRSRPPRHPRLFPTLYFRSLPPFSDPENSIFLLLSKLEIASSKWSVSTILSSCCDFCNQRSKHSNIAHFAFGRHFGFVEPRQFLELDAVSHS